VGHSWLTLLAMTSPHHRRNYGTHTLMHTRTHKHPKTRHACRSLRRPHGPVYVTLPLPARCRRQATQRRASCGRSCWTASACTRRWGRLHSEIGVRGKGGSSPPLVLADRCFAGRTPTWCWQVGQGQTGQLFLQDLKGLIRNGLLAPFTQLPAHCACQSACMHDRSVEGWPPPSGCVHAAELHGPRAAPTPASRTSVF
jgi:hypothetical protein